MYAEVKADDVVLSQPRYLLPTTVSHPILATLADFGQPRPKIEGFAGGREAGILTYGRILTWDFFNFELGAAHEQG